MQDNTEGYGPESLEVLRSLGQKRMSDEMRSHLNVAIEPEMEEAWLAELARLHRETPHEDAARILARRPTVWPSLEDDANPTES